MNRGLGSEFVTYISLAVSPRFSFLHKSVFSFYSFVVYLTTPSVIQIALRHMIWLWWKNEFETISKVAVMAWFFLGGGLRKTMNSLRQVSPDMNVAKR